MMSEIKISEKSKEIEKFAQELADKANEELDGAMIYNVLVTISPPYRDNNRVHFTGHIGVYIKYDAEQPEFLMPEDEKLWQLKMDEIAEKATKLNHINYTSIGFSGKSEEDLYELSATKKESFRTGFEKIKTFVKWYCSSVKLYGDFVAASHNLAMENYLKILDTAPELHV